MGAIFLVKLDENNNEQYRYRLANLKRLRYIINTPVNPLPLPEETSSEQVLIKIEGNSSTIELNWIIKNESVDLETANSLTVRTVPEQLAFFRHRFVPISVEDKFQLILQFGSSIVRSTILIVPSKIISSSEEDSPN